MKKLEDCCQIKMTLNTVAAAKMHHCVGTHRHSADTQQRYYLHYLVLKTEQQNALHLALGLTMKITICTTSYRTQCLWTVSKKGERKLANKYKKCTTKLARM